MSELDINEIVHYLPHRFPFLLVDRVVEYEIGARLRAIKNVTINEPFFAGHFPQQPVMPGVLILEALGQACVVLSEKSREVLEPGTKCMHYLAGIDNARFKQMVVPGDQLELNVTLMGKRRNIWRMHGEGVVNGKVVCTADLISAVQEIESDK